MYFIHKIGTVKLIRQEKYMLSSVFLHYQYICTYIVKYDIVTKKNPECSNKQVMMATSALHREHRCSVPSI